MTADAPLVQVEAATYHPVTILEVPAQPRKERAAAISQSQFTVLREGPPGRRFASRRDVCVGIAATALVGALGIVVTGQFYLPGPAPGADGPPNLPLWIVTVLLVAGGVAAAIIARFAHKDATAAGGSAYQACVGEIEAQFGGPKQQ